MSEWTSISAYRMSPTWKWSWVPCWRWPENIQKSLSTLLPTYYIWASATRHGTCGFVFGLSIRDGIHRCAQKLIARSFKSSGKTASKFRFPSATCTCDLLFRFRQPPKVSQCNLTGDYERRLGKLFRRYRQPAPDPVPVSVKSGLAFMNAGSGLSLFGAAPEVRIWQLHVQIER
jgi:hypothetical protein